MCSTSSSASLVHLLPELSYLSSSSSSGTMSSLIRFLPTSTPFNSGIIYSIITSMTPCSLRNSSMASTTTLIMFASTMANGGWIVTLTASPGQLVRLSILKPAYVPPIHGRTTLRKLSHSFFPAAILLGRPLLSRWSMPQCLYWCHLQTLPVIPLPRLPIALTMIFSSSPSFEVSLPMCQLLCPPYVCFPLALL